MSENPWVEKLTEATEYAGLGEQAMNTKDYATAAECFYEAHNLAIGDQLVRDEYWQKFNNADRLGREQKDKTKHKVDYSV